MYIYVHIYLHIYLHTHLHLHTSVLCLADRPDNLGFFTEDSPSGSGATVSDIKQKSDPFPGDHLSTDDLFLLRASFLSKYNHILWS